MIGNGDIDIKNNNSMHVSYLNCLAPGRYCGNLKSVIFVYTWQIKHFLWKLSECHKKKGSIGSGNGLVPLGDKPLPEPMLIQICAAIWRHSVFKISAGPGTLKGKIWVGPAIFPSLSYINFDKIVLRPGKFQILFWRLVTRPQCVD